MGRFEQQLHELEQERHRGILSSLVARGRLRRRRAATDDGYLPPRDAAAEMGLELEELSELVRTGMLESRPVGRRLYVRPAVVSRMGIQA
jgi:hypothetical protein